MNLKMLASALHHVSLSGVSNEEDTQRDMWLVRLVGSPADSIPAIHAMRRPCWDVTF